MTKVLTIHGWAFCPKVFEPLGGLGEVKHYEIGYYPLDRETLRVAEEITPQTIVVGWSLGATLSVLASFLKKPKGLILIGSTPYFRRAWKREYIERFFKELEENFERKIEEFRKTVWGENICQNTPLDKKRAIALLEEFVETDISEKVKNLEIPALLLHGKKDPITPFREAKKMLKLNSRLKLIPYDGGHFPKEFTEGDWKEIFKGLQEL